MVCVVKKQHLQYSLSILLIILKFGSIEQKLGQEQSLIDVINVLISALKSGNEQRILDCTPGKEDFKKLASLEMRDSGYTDSEMDTILKIFNERAIENMKRIQNDGKKLGLTWNLIEVDSMASVKRRGTKETFPGYTVSLWVSQENRQWCIILTEVTLISGKWLLTDRFKFKE